MSAPTMTPLKVVAPGEIARILLLVICIGLLLTGSLWILLPFLFALAWATMIVIATWPILLKVQQAAGGRRWVGVVVMTILALATFVGPLLAAVSTMFDAATNSPAVLRDLVARGLGPPPAWVANLPVVGARWGTRATPSWRRRSNCSAPKATRSCACWRAWSTRASARPKVPRNAPKCPRGR